MVKIYGLDGSVVGEAKLPKVFSTKYRPEVIQRAVLALQSSRRQPYGTDVLAGKRTSAHYHGSRKYRFSMMNKELSRIPRIHGKGAGHMALRARFAPHAVKGRAAHPPKVEKVWEKKINNKENMLAIKSALAASANLNLLKSRGHLYNDSIPIVMSDDFSNITKTKEVEKALEKILSSDLERCKKRKIRPGKGKMRGRKYRQKKGPLIIVDAECNLLKSAKNIAGVDVTTIEKMNAEMLAPGAQAGRLTIFTQAALEKLDDHFEVLRKSSGGKKNFERNFKI
jgi:large subunit ribosomal protein L4e